MMEGGLKKIDTKSFCDDGIHSDESDFWPNEIDDNLKLMIDNNVLCKNIIETANSLKQSQSTAQCVKPRKSSTCKEETSGPLENDRKILTRSRYKARENLIEKPESKFEEDNGTEEFSYDEQCDMISFLIETNRISSCCSIDIWQLMALKRSKRSPQSLLKQFKNMIAPEISQFLHQLNIIRLPGVLKEFKLALNKERIQENQLSASFSETSSSPPITEESLRKARKRKCASSTPKTVPPKKFANSNKNSTEKTKNSAEKTKNCAEKTKNCANKIIESRQTRSKIPSTISEDEGNEKCYDSDDDDDSFLRSLNEVNDESELIFDKTYSDDSESSSELISSRSYNSHASKDYYKVNNNNSRPGTAENIEDFNAKMKDSTENSDLPKKEENHKDFNEVEENHKNFNEVEENHKNFKEVEENHKNFRESVGTKLWEQMYGPITIGKRQRFHRIKINENSVINRSRKLRSVDFSEELLEALVNGASQAISNFRWCLEEDLAILHYFICRPHEIKFCRGHKVFVDIFNKNWEILQSRSLAAVKSHFNEYMLGYLDQFGLPDEVLNEFLYWEWYRQHAPVKKNFSSMLEYENEGEHSKFD